MDSLSGRGHGSASKETASHGPAWQSCMSRECGDHAEATAGTHLVVAQQLGVDCGETHGAPRGPTETEAKQEQATRRRSRPHPSVFTLPCPTDTSLSRFRLLLCQTLATTSRSKTGTEARRPCSFVPGVPLLTSGVGASRSLSRNLRLSSPLQRGVSSPILLHVVSSTCIFTSTASKGSRSAAELPCGPIRSIETYTSTPHGALSFPVYPSPALPTRR